MATKKLPDQAYLRECFHYDPTTGVLTWKLRPRTHFAHLSPRSVVRIQRSWNSRLANKVAGTVHPRDGYVMVDFISFGPLGAHRLIWRMVTGDDIPEIDHRDGNRADNRWKNLRPATRSQNQHNRRCNSRRTGLKGTTKQPLANSYFARIKIEGKPIYLGSFKTEAEAHAAYCAAARKYFGEFWNPG